VWIAAVLSLPLATPLPAQEPAAVGGVVVDAQSNAPIPGVEIRVFGSNRTIVTGEDGRFLLAEIPRGSQRIVFRHIAYGEHERTLELEESGTRQYLIRMSREAIELEPLVIDGRRVRRRGFPRGR
jgi:iron complex outermembrane receptor protein